MDWLLPFLRNLVIGCANLGTWLISPILDVPNLPDFVTSPLALISVGGLTLALVMNLISLLNPLN